MSTSALVKDPWNARPCGNAIHSIVDQRSLAWIERLVSTTTVSTWNIAEVEIVANATTKRISVANVSELRIRKKIT